MLQAPDRASYSPRLGTDVPILPPRRSVTIRLTATGEYRHNLQPLPRLQTTRSPLRSTSASAFRAGYKISWTSDQSSFTGRRTRPTTFRLTAVRNSRWSDAPTSESRACINAVLKRKAVARVSQTPGKTQAIQFYLINETLLHRRPARLRLRKGPEGHAALVGRAGSRLPRERRALRLIFILLDVRRTPSTRTSDARLDARVRHRRTHPVSPRATSSPTTSWRRAGATIASELADRPKTGSSLFRHHENRNRTSPARDRIAPLNEESFNQRGLNQCPKPNSKTKPTVRRSRAARSKTHREAEARRARPRGKPKAPTRSRCRPPRRRKTAAVAAAIADAEPERPKRPRASRSSP